MCPTSSPAFAKPQFRNIEGKGRGDALYTVYSHFINSSSSVFVFVFVLSLSVFVFVFKCVPLFPFAKPRFRNIGKGRCILHILEPLYQLVVLHYQEGAANVFYRASTCLIRYHKSFILPITFSKCIPQKE